MIEKRAKARFTIIPCCIHYVSPIIINIIMPQRKMHRKSHLKQQNTMICIDAFYRVIHISALPSLLMYPCMRPILVEWNGTTIRDVVFRRIQQAYANGLTMSYLSRLPTSIRDWTWFVAATGIAQRCKGVHSGTWRTFN